MIYGIKTDGKMPPVSVSKKKTPLLVLHKISCVQNVPLERFEK